MGPVTMCENIWQFEDSLNVWKSYSESHSKALTAALDNKESTCDLKLPDGSGISVDLSKGIQSPKESVGHSRKIRLVFHSKSEDKAFVWQADLKPWANMPPPAAKWLEEARCAGEAAASLRIGANDYSVDLRKLTQTNSSTGFRRNVRRRQLPPREWPQTARAADATAASGSGRRTSARLAAGKRQQSSSPDDGGAGDPEKATRRPEPKRKAAKSAKEEEEKPAAASSSSERVLLLKGGAAVDSELKGLSPDAVSVYVDASGCAYDAMLNQTNLQFNNNKFYLLQVLRQGQRYWTWFRWGRVGKAGQCSLAPCGSDLQRAVGLFCQKFLDKTKNEWADRAKFKKVAGKYDLVERDHRAADADADSGAGAGADADAEESRVACQLSEAVQQLLKLICDVAQMEQTVVEMRYDAKRMPLGKLTPAQVKAGFAALKEVEDCIRRGGDSRQLVAACNKFYTRIPHDFGMRVPPVIRTSEEVQAKSDLLQALEQIQTALKVIKSDDKPKAEHPLDRYYRRLDCSIEEVPAGSGEHKLVDRYLQLTHGPTHNLYKLSIDCLYRVRRGAEAARCGLGNRQLLWHGSRVSNWAGIVAQGLRVAPPEAPATGYMFGKGVYFADVSSKSANYLYATRSRPVGILCLCDVALGNSRQLTKADYGAADLPPGCHSVKGLGQLVPDSSTFETLDADDGDGGCCVPAGKLVPSNYETVLNYNEFVVYSPEQVRMRYLLRVRFNFR